TGGSKDINDVSQWRFTNGSVPDKDEILDAYAAAYTCGVGNSACTAGDLIIYFGLDRLANNGTADAGFWFLQSNVHPITSGPDAGKFSGNHQDGDILVVIEFTGGGVIATATAFQWVGGASGSLQPLGAVTTCGAGGDKACAISNTSPVQLYWPYVPKVPAGVNMAPTGSFLEGGINVTALLKKTPCFTSFLAETRSSAT